ARHDHLVLRRLCLVAKGWGRKRERPITTLVAPSDRHRQGVRRGNPGHRPPRQSHAQKIPWLQDPFSGNPQRAWQRRANPVCIALLHLAPESRRRDFLKGAGLLGAAAAVTPPVTANASSPIPDLTA